MDKISVTIIGAGVVGLAIAAELSKKYSDVVLLEKESSFGQGTSSRNSEVIHAGIYYPKDSLKAKLCVKGNKLLYAFCQENNIPHARLGKLIVAMDQSDVLQLEELEVKARANGVNDLRWMSAQEISVIEPAVKACRALFSPSTGIIDSHALMKVLERKAQERGCLLAYGSQLTAVKCELDGYLLSVNGEPLLKTEILINSAGLFANQVVAMLGIDIEKSHYKVHYCKGEYFSYSRPSFLKHLVYPVPEQDLKGLGIHAVLDLAGGVKFGPNAEYVNVIDYNVNPEHRKLFFNAIKGLYPQVKEEELAPDQAGVRPKLQGPGDPVRDFVIQEESANGFPRLINLVGIESP
ncbi:MAG: NAD(P)/FAD-dependent oxidoreductase, partial [Candidatus Margulisiibacteriota bacterium]